MKRINITCPVCGSKAYLRPASVVYGDKAPDPDAKYYVCGRYPACDCYVAAHRKTMLPMGTLADIRRAPLGGHQRIRLMDDSGTAHDLLLDRRQRFLIGSSYRIYLQSSPGAALPEARIPHGTLLGLEDLGECRVESEIDCQAAAQEGSDIIKTERFNE